MPWGAGGGAEPNLEMEEETKSAKVWPFHCRTRLDWACKGVSGWEMSDDQLTWPAAVTYAYACTAGSVTSSAWRAGFGIVLSVQFRSWAAHPIHHNLSEFTGCKAKVNETLSVSPQQGWCSAVKEMSEVQARVYEFTFWMHGFPGPSKMPAWTASEMLLGDIY